jgi:type IV pilus assembly protein PilF
MLFRIISALIALSLFSCAGATSKEKEAIMHFKLGNSYLESNQLQAAFIEYQKGLQYDKGDKQIYNALGYIYLKFDDLDKAEASFLKAVSLDREYSDSYNNLCKVYYDKKDYEKAITNCDKALQNPLYVTPQRAFYNLGNIFYRLKRYPESIKAYKDALKREEGFYPAYYGLALAHNALNEYGPASAALENAIRLDPQFGGDMERAEEKIKKRAASPVPEEDMDSLIEVFRY